jgi:NAD dependent epimerase/dehydratase
VSAEAWRGRRVLVTGAGGFIGSHLVERLVAEGAKVRALVRYNGRDEHGMLDAIDPRLKSEVEVVLGDIRDPFGVDKLVEGQEVVFHLAALIGIPYSYRAPADYVATNVAGTLNALEACRRHGVARLVHTSTSEVYGSARRVPMDESHPLQGQSPYSASKIGADALVESYVRAFGLAATTVRPFNTYGPRQSARAVVPTILSQALAGETVRLGALDPVRDLTYVSDTVAGFLALAAAPGAAGRVVNLGSGRGIAIGELARLCLELAGSRAEVVSERERVRPGASEVERLVADASLAASLAGWRAEVDIREGLEHTRADVAAHLGRYRIGRYAV